MDVTNRRTGFWELASATRGALLFRCIFRGVKPYRVDLMAAATICRVSITPPCCLMAKQFHGRFVGLIRDRSPSLIRAHTIRQSLPDVEITRHRFCRHRSLFHHRMPVNSVQVFLRIVARLPERVNWDAQHKSTRSSSYSHNWASCSLHPVTCITDPAFPKFWDIHLTQSCSSRSLTLPFHTHYPNYDAQDHVRLMEPLRHFCAPFTIFLTNRPSTWVPQRDVFVYNTDGSQHDCRLVQHGREPGGSRNCV
jgi:hypothetical protein